jgi:AcrR family transcriptional regulator
MSKRMSREERQQQTRQRLLDAAADIFSQRGYHAATVDEIAEAAGFSKGAVYSNFASKEELFLALLDQHFEREIQSWEGPCVEAGTEGGEQGTKLSYIEAIERDRAWNLLLTEFLLYAIREESIRPKLAERLRRLQQHLRDHLAEVCATRTQQPTLPPEYLPWLVNALDVGLSLLAYLDVDAVPPDLYEATLDHLLS